VMSTLLGDRLKCCRDLLETCATKMTKNALGPGKRRARSSDSGYLSRDQPVSEPGREGSLK
jgi:hypothetical protein